MKFILALSLVLSTSAAFADQKLTSALFCEQEIQNQKAEYSFFNDYVGYKSGNPEQVPVLMLVRVSDAKGRKVLKTAMVGKWAVEKIARKQPKDPNDPYGDLFQDYKIIGFVSNDKKVVLLIGQGSSRRKESQIKIKQQMMKLGCYWDNRFDDWAY